MIQHLKESPDLVVNAQEINKMYVNPYRNSAPYELRQYVEKLKEKLKKELKNPQPDITKLNKIREAMYMPDIFENSYIGYERFRNPW